MKYVIINGSPRKGNTYGIINAVKSNLEGDFVEFHLADEKIPMCRGCFNCVVNGEEYCPHYDKINPIICEIEDCDAIIIGSPVYAMNVSALLKNFFDHTAYLFHRSKFSTKKAMVVVSTAGAGHKKVAKYMDETMRHWGVNKVYSISMAVGGKEIDTSRVDKVSLKFLNDLKSGKLHSPKFMDIIFFNVWKAMAKSDNPIKADKEFWYSTGLVNHDFFPEVKLGFVKNLFSKIICFVMCRVIK